MGPLIYVGYYLVAAAFFFCSAHRLFTASAIRFRPSGVRRLFFGCLKALRTPAGDPVGGTPPVNTALACCKAAISWSICARISEIPTVCFLRVIVYVSLRRGPVRLLKTSYDSAVAYGNVDYFTNNLFAEMLLQCQHVYLPMSGHWEQHHWPDAR